MNFEVGLVVDFTFSSIRPALFIVVVQMKNDHYSQENLNIAPILMCTESGHLKTDSERIGVGMSGREFESTISTT